MLRPNLKCEASQFVFIKRRNKTDIALQCPGECAVCYFSLDEKKTPNFPFKQMYGEYKIFLKIPQEVQIHS